MNTAELPLIKGLCDIAENLMIVSNKVLDTARNTADGDMTDDARTSLTSLVMVLQSTADRCLETACLCAEPVQADEPEPEPEPGPEARPTTRPRQGGGTPPPKAG